MPKRLQDVIKSHGDMTRYQLERLWSYNRLYILVQIHLVGCGPPLFQFFLAARERLPTIIFVL